jgi:hypothetical protein
VPQPAPNGACGSGIRKDHILVDFGQAIEKSDSFSNLDMRISLRMPKHSVESRMLYPNSAID